MNREAPRRLLAGDVLTLVLTGVTRDGGALASSGDDLTVEVDGASVSGAGGLIGCFRSRV